MRRRFVFNIFAAKRSRRPSPSRHYLRVLDANRISLPYLGDVFPLHTGLSLSLSCVTIDDARKKYPDSPRDFPHFVPPLPLRLPPSRPIAAITLRYGRNLLFVARRSKCTRTGRIFRWILPPPIRGSCVRAPSDPMKRNRCFTRTHGFARVLCSRRRYYRSVYYIV